ncbi:hypothetical protein NEHOM01_0104 [Nematocida homosporus]|uniref:uncharacterized protein n=1 Tax=Nematocida homosporus TaxID=1912981 RepID=UPI00221EF043|nr:uncharacterized protein NEHOM01_0104 [Nematocida homosporus]KAI5184359.1 hypothetical protein NEHOM01_0104 [Nematocida homosporus]
MDKKKRYAWIEVFRSGDNTMIYDHLGVKESFNEFFDGVMHIDRGKDIRRYYRISLHLIIFLIIQKQIKDHIDSKKPLSSEELRILELRPQELFWQVTKKMPKAFVFSKVPVLTVPDEHIANIKEIAKELANLGGGKEKPPAILCYQAVLTRALRGEETLGIGLFREDGFNLDTIQDVFKQMVKMKQNQIVYQFYLKYETVYFMNLYCRHREKRTDRMFADEDIQFVQKKRDRDEGILPANASPGTYEVRVTDRKFVIILHVAVMEFIKRMGFSRSAEALLLSILRTFLLKERLLGYFADYSAEIMLIAFSYIALHASRRKVSLTKVFSVYQEIGFVVPFCLVKDRNYTVTIEDLTNQAIIKTYNSLLPSIIRNIRVPKRPAEPSTPSSITTPKRKDLQGQKYILSPLSGRMSQILPVNKPSRKILFKDSS